MGAYAKRCGSIVYLLEYGVGFVFAIENVVDLSIERT